MFSFGGGDGDYFGFYAWGTVKQWCDFIKQFILNGAGLFL